MSFVLAIVLIRSPFLIMAGGYLGFWLATHGGAGLMTARLPITEAAMRRAINAARKAGLPIVATEITPNGTVRLIHEGVAPTAAPISDGATSKVGYTAAPPPGARWSNDHQAWILNDGIMEKVNEATRV
jgi:hypothetical protein